MFGLLQHLFHPTQCYALCAVARSGAHLLSGALQATHLAGRPLQYFHERLAHKYADRYGLDATRNFAQYLRGLLTGAATSNGVFGFRIESFDVDWLVRRLRDTGEFGSSEADERELLRAAFPRLRCVQLTRENKLRQAISRARAMQTNLWVPGKEHNVIGVPAFDPGLIDDCLVSATRAEELWAEFFARNQLDPFAITYEELCSDYRRTVTRVFDFLRIRPPRHIDLGAPRTVRQADALTEEWVGKYRALREAGAKSLNRES
ncbi:MAG: Stf0 family sulfotransferase [Chthoniobacterales bacterium]